MSSESDWQRRIAGKVALGAPLGEALDALLLHQRAAWPLLREGEAALATSVVRRIDVESGHVTLQANARRRASTSAKVDPASVAQRPCFLCEAQLPTEERGIAFGDDYIAFTNPFPILPGHLSVVARAHQPQAIAGRVIDLLRLSQSLGPDWIALYNGPRCGASAPDHLHFQAGRVAALPIEIDFDVGASADSSLPAFGVAIVENEALGRRALRFRGRNHVELAAEIETAIVDLQRITCDREEPLLNLVARSDERGATVLLFPRGQHRPRQFFASGDDHILVSPGALDMAGLVVVAEPSHLDRIDAAVLRDIFEQVTLDQARFEQLVASLWDLA